MKTTYLILSLTILTSLMSVSCSKDENKVEEEDILNTLSLNQEQLAYAYSSTRFAFNLLDEVNKRNEESFFISPLSMQYLLGMIANGAQGETASQIIDALGYGDCKLEAINKYHLELIKQLPTLDKKTKMEVANAIFADKDINLLDEYKRAVSNYYEAEVSNVDFSDSKALEIINSWCSKKTNSLVPKIVDNLSPNMVVALSTIYFESKWRNPFDENLTQWRPFYKESGETTDVQMMAQKTNMSYVRMDDFDALLLGYANLSYSMFILLPHEGKSVSDITQYLRNTDWDEFTSKFIKTYEVDFWLPKFETNFRTKVNEVLQELGIKEAFSSNADFKSMTQVPLGNLQIEQASSIKVDESGTKAAAVSSGKWYPTAPPPTPKAVFHADHPFIYLIAERSSKAILFAGKYTGK